MSQPIYETILQKLHTLADPNIAQHSLRFLKLDRVNTEKVINFLEFEYEEMVKA